MKQSRRFLWTIWLLCVAMMIFSGCGQDEQSQQPGGEQSSQQGDTKLPGHDDDMWSDMTGWEGSYILEQAQGAATELVIYPEEREKWMKYYADKMNLSLLPVFTEGEKIDEQLLINSGIIFAPWIEIPYEELTDEFYYNYYLEKDALENGVLRHMGQKVEKPQTTDLLIYDEEAGRYYLEVFGIAESYYLRLEMLLETNDGDLIGCFDAYSSFSIMEEDMAFEDEEDVFAYFNEESTEGLPEVAMKVIIKWHPLDNGEGTDVLYLAHEELAVK